MKALILAAGFGTRLRPHTEHTPKALFPLAGRPVLEHMILNLVRCGCTAVIVNTHHLHQRIEEYIAGRTYDIPVATRHEPEILGTGGAIKNVADFLGDKPFLVVNADIVTDIDLKEVYRFHNSSGCPATLVLHDHAAYNTVAVDQDHLIVGFGDPSPAGSKKLAFTGIQVLDPGVIDLIPGSGFYHSIDLYRRLIRRGPGVRAFISRGRHWTDIGTPGAFRQAVFDHLAGEAFADSAPAGAGAAIECRPLTGDGSDRRWFRVIRAKDSLVMADHGISTRGGVAEVDAFVDIGRHLYSKGLPVPRIYRWDRFSGLVFMQDLGKVHLLDRVRRARGKKEITALYRRVIDSLVEMSFIGKNGFKTAWTHQTPRYDRELILQKECRYFVEAFLNGYLGLGVSYDDLRLEFEQLADGALADAIYGLMHRDLQSRNIMVRGQGLYFIDFQGARIGPLQYDLASLLIDPYVDLTQELESELLAYALEAYRRRAAVRADGFMRGYRHLALCRNLQALGAFGYLSRKKKKTVFETYIPAALRRLKVNLANLGPADYPGMASLVEKLN